VLLDAVVEGLKRLPETRLGHLPRMADFAAALDKRVAGIERQERGNGRLSQMSEHADHKFSITPHTDGFSGRRLAGSRLRRKSAFFG
jgi:hypothetical protein